MRLKNIRSGFSLIEVNMAILIAAGGLISLFALFPVSLRQSVMSTADLHQATFASSFFEAVSANIREIDDIDRWNNIEAFWDDAVKGTRITDKLKQKTRLYRPSEMKRNASYATAELIADELNAGSEKLRFVVREEDEDGDKDKKNFAEGKLKLPPQMVIRIRPIEDDRRRLPNRYVVSLLSTHEFAPAIFHHNTVYSVEFYFRRRP